MEGNEEEIKEISESECRQSKLLNLTCAGNVFQGCENISLHFLHTSSLTCLGVKSQTAMELKGFQARELFQGPSECFCKTQPQT